MIYTARFCHLETIPPFYIGVKIPYNTKIGRMGNTGSSTAAHLHLGCVDGVHPSPWRLSEMDPLRKKKKKVWPNSRQLSYFADEELFNTEIAITSFFLDPEYKDKDGKMIIHPALDVVPKNRKPEYFDIYWNRSWGGKVIGKGFDNGYGNYIHIAFETE